MPEAQEIKKVKRTEFAAFLNTGTKETKKWSRIGKGVTGQTVAYNPTVTEEQYINEESGTSSIEAYKVNVPTPQTAYKGDPVFDYVDNMRRKRLVNADAETEILFVYLYEKTVEGEEPSQTIKYAAEQNNCAIQVDDFGGDAGNPVVLNYTINLNGDPTLGSVTMNNGEITFTPDTSAAG